MSKPTLPPSRRIAADDRDLERRVRTLETRTTGALSAPTWTYFGNGWDPGTGVRPRYCKDALGFVHVQGICTNGTGSAVAGATIFTLPAGFRPEGNPVSAAVSRQHFTVVVTQPGLVNTSLTIGADGEIRLLGSVSIPTTEIVYLGNIMFYAEQ